MHWKKQGDVPVYGLIVDVLSGSVGLTLIYSDPHEVAPEILYSHREYIRVVENPDTPTMMRSLRSALFAGVLHFSEQGIAKLQGHDKKAHVDRVMLVCGAPWAQTATRLIHVSEESPFTVTPEKIGALVKAAEDRDEEEFKKSSLLRELNLHLVEHTVVNTAVNGYMLHDPYGKKGTELSLAHISGLIPQPILDSVSEIEDKLVTHAEKSMHTFSLMLFCVLRDIYPLTRNALYIDVSGEATELGIMQDEVLLESFVFPRGGNTTVRDLAKELGTLPEEALGHLKEDGDSAPESVKVPREHVRDTFVTDITSALKELSEKYIIPKNMFLITSAGLEKFFEKGVLKATEPYRGAHGSLTILNDAVLKEVAGVDGEKKDVFGTLEARFFHKLHGCGEVS